MTRCRSVVTAALLDEALVVIGELQPFWPVTLRQIYYGLVARQALANRRSEYQKLSRLLTNARLAGSVPWESMEDRARQVLVSGGWPGSREFLGHERHQFLRGYRRDLLQSQPVALEVWIEKDALSRICHDVAFEYCVPVVVARGFTSTSFARECYDRVLEARAAGKDGLRILYFGDLDPSGWAMLPALLQTLHDEMGLPDEVVDGERCALTPGQVSVFRLPYSVDALKDTDSRAPAYRRWLAARGHPTDLAVELDALQPAQLQALVRAAIESNLDMDLFHREQKAEARDRRALAGVRSSAMELLDELEGDL